MFFASDEIISADSNSVF